MCFYRIVLKIDVLWCTLCTLACRKTNIYRGLTATTTREARVAFAALREAIIRCRHVVYFVTEEFLSQGRGWNSVETAYSELLQANLMQPALVLCNLQLPLFCLPRNHATLESSAWGSCVQSGRFYPPGKVDGGAVNWAHQEIAAFIKQEENRGHSLATQIEKDPSFQRILADEKTCYHV